MPARRIAPLLAMLVLVLAPLSAAAHATPSTPGATATPTDDGCLSDAALCALVGTSAARALEEKLAQKYAPVVYLKTQTGPCDGQGEPYLPSPVEIVLNDPEVVLRKNMGGYDADKDPIVKRGPTAADLAGKDASHYLDLPGDPREPGCTYERFSKRKMAGLQPIVYAHVVLDRGDGIDGTVVLQYFFYYAFNRFNNLHESDWEMIQLLFSTPSLEAALSTDGPDELAYAQHDGGELGTWGSDKVGVEDGHPVVYPASGSHATYYGQETYIGWGEKGSGLGCDHTIGPSTRITPEVRLVPDQPDPTGPYAWLTFDGHWGEKDSFPYDGPTGPNSKTQWSDPVGWEADLRESSLPIGQHQSFGPNPAGLFCTGVSFLAGLYSDKKHYAWYSYSVIALLILVPTLLLFLYRRILGRSIRMFIRHGRVFAPIGIGMIVVGAAATYLDDVLGAIPYGGPVINGILGLATPSPLAFFPSSNNPVNFIGWTMVIPAVIHVVAELQGNRRTGAIEALGFVRRRFWTLLRATVRNTAILGLLTVSIVGIPWAIVRLVRWSLSTQAVIMDGAGWREAGAVSRQSVVGRWWRTLLTLLVVGFIVAAIAPVAGILVLIFVNPSVLVANAVSGAVYALTFPFAGIVTSLWYLDRRGPAANVETESVALNSVDSAPAA